MNLYLIGIVGAGIVFCMVMAFFNHAFITMGVILACFLMFDYKERKNEDVIKER